MDTIEIALYAYRHLLRAHHPGELKQIACVIDALQAHADTLAKLDREEDDRRKCDAMIEDLRAKLTAAEQQVEAERTIANENRRINAGLCEQVAELGLERANRLTHLDEILRQETSLNAAGRAHLATRITAAMQPDTTARRDTVSRSVETVNVVNKLVQELDDMRTFIIDRDFSDDTSTGCIDAQEAIDAGRKWLAALHPSDAK